MNPTLLSHEECLAKCNILHRVFDKPSLCGQATPLSLVLVLRPLSVIRFALGDKHMTTILSIAQPGPKCNLTNAHQRDVVCGVEISPLPWCIGRKVSQFEAASFRSSPARLKDLNPLLNCATADCGDL